MESNVIIQQLVNGITQGTSYSLIAIGYVLIYGGLRRMNFSHSDVYMVGAMLSYTFYGFFLSSSTNMFLQIGAGLVVGMIGTAVLGWIIEKVAFRPLRFAPMLACSICTMGFSYILREGSRLIWGSESKRFIYSIKWLESYKIEAINLTITNLQIFMFVAAILLVILLELFLHKTNTGRAIRAVSINQTAAQIVGINMDRVFSITFMLASAISGAAGVLVGFYYNMTSPYIGAMPGMKAFAAIVLGGVSSIWGAFTGGILLGLCENIGGMILGDIWRDGVAYAIFFIVILLRPRGLFGKKEDVM